MAEKKTIQDNPGTKEKSGQVDPVVKTKKAKNVRKNLNEKKRKPRNDKVTIEDLQKKQESIPKKNPFSTKEFKTYNSSTLDTSKILYSSYEDKVKDSERSLEDIAIENLKRSLDRRVATIFRGTIMGNSKVTSASGIDTYFFIVNSNCNVTGYKGRTIRIPLSEYIAPISTPDDMQPQAFDIKDKSEEAIYAYMNSRVGSIVEFVVTNMDPENYESGFVIASRLPALQKRIEKYWHGKTLDKETGKYVDLINEGTIINARVVSVVPNGVYCELFGMEVFVSLKELDYRYHRTARGLYKQGENLNIKIKNLARTDEKITFYASHKDTYKDPAPAYMSAFLPGDNVKGRVEMTIFDEKVGRLFYIVSVDNKFELGAIPKGGMQVTANPGDIVEVKILEVNVDLEKNTGKVIGKIKHITRNPDFGI